MSSLTWLTFDIEAIEGDEKAFSMEYLVDGTKKQLCLYFPNCVIQIKTRWE